MISYRCIICDLHTNVGIQYQEYFLASKHYQKINKGKYQGYAYIHAYTDAFKVTVSYHPSFSHNYALLKSC